MELLMKTLLSITLIMIALCGAVAGYHYSIVDVYAVSEAPPLPVMIEDWSDEQLEDETLNYLDAIVTIKDEQKRRAAQ